MFRLFALIGILAAGFPVAALNLDGSFWNSNWNVMSFHQNGNKVSAEYIYDKGVITATFSGDTLRGWWREYNNAQTCGPQGVWSGAIAFLFSPDGKSFTGDWNYCGSNDSALVVTGTTWAGTLRDSSITETECLAGGRYWCQNACVLSPCGQITTETECVAAARFWCSGTCLLDQCSAAIRPRAQGRPGMQSIENGTGILVDLQGRCLESTGRNAQGNFIFHR